MVHDDHGTDCSVGKINQEETVYQEETEVSKIVYKSTAGVNHNLSQDSHHLNCAVFDFR